MGEDVTGGKKMQQTQHIGSQHSQLTFKRGLRENEGKTTIATRTSGDQDYLGIDLGDEAKKAGDRRQSGSSNRKRG